MLIREAKVGMVVKANVRSNGRYGITNETNDFVGIIRRVSGEDFDIECTEITRDCNRIGHVYTGLEPEYFDIVEDDKVKIVLKEEVYEDGKVGDFVVIENGQIVYVSHDTDGSDFRAVNMVTGVITLYTETFAELIKRIERDFGKVIRVIKANNITITEV